MSIALISAGTIGTQLQIDPTNLAARVSYRPKDLNLGGVSLPAPYIGGYYRHTAKSGLLTGAGANTPVWSLRWVQPDVAMHLVSFKWYYTTTTGFTAGQLVDHALYIARGWTTNDTGQTASSPILSTDQKKRSAFVDASLVGQIMISGTGAITPGVRTLDAFPITVQAGWCATTTQGVGTVNPDFDTKLNELGEHPVVLTYNEGLVLNNLTAMGAAGVITLYVELAWAEIPLITY